MGIAIRVNCTIMFLVNSLLSCVVGINRLLCAFVGFFLCAMGLSILHVHSRQSFELQTGDLDFASITGDCSVFMIQSFSYRLAL